MLIRELPPLWHDIEIELPSGRRLRWGDDARRAEDVPAQLRHSSTMPGGFESMDCTLARDPALRYPDLEQFSKLRVRSAGGEIVSETRLERAPRSTGDGVSVSPSSVGMQAHLDDDESASMVYIDRDLGRWGPIGAQGRIFYNSSWAIYDPSVSPDQVSSRPALRAPVPAGAANVTRPWGVSAYDAGDGNRIGAIYYRWERFNVSGDPGTNPAYAWYAAVSSDDGFIGGTESTSDLQANGPGSGIFTPTNKRRYGFLYWQWNATGWSSSFESCVLWSEIAVVGDHGLPVYGAAPDLGMRDGDIVAHAIAKWAPLLKTVDSSGQSTITPSDFPIPHLAFYDRTTAGEIVKQTTRFGLRDWAVWEDATFWLHDRGARGRSWRARVAPSGLEETGPQADRVWESIIVEFRDVDGTIKTVGPPGSGATVESALLRDPDPDNPATLLGITRRDRLQMGVSRADRAISVGELFLAQAKQLSTSGRARLVGHVLDDRGVLHPFTHVRAGDTISFIDADDTSPRRIVKADHSHAELAVSIDLDAPPEGLQALLERLGVDLIPRGA